MHTITKYAVISSIRIRSVPRNQWAQYKHGIHLKLRPFKCDYCDYAATQSSILQEHRVRMHTLEWRYNCDFCEDEGVEKGFLTPGEMRKHQMKNHPEQYQAQLEKEKPAVCPTCGKRFPDEKQVEIHIRKIHKEK